MRNSVTIKELAKLPCRARTPFVTTLVRKWWEQHPDITKCKWCKKRFTRKRNDNVFCSITCRVYSHRNRKIK